MLPAYNPEKFDLEEELISSKEEYRIKLNKVNKGRKPRHDLNLKQFREIQILQTFTKPFEKNI